jgi:hypothetical protein
MNFAFHISVQTNHIDFNSVKSNTKGDKPHVLVGIIYQILMVFVFFFLFTD